MDTVHVCWGARRGGKIPLVKKHRVALIQNSNDAPRTEVRPNQVVIAEEKATSHCITVQLGAFNARGMKRHAYHYCRSTIQAQS